MNLGLKNSEGYYDPTAYHAIKNVCEEEKKIKKSKFLKIKAPKNRKKPKEVKS